MDLTFNPEEVAFRDEVRTFLREQLPDDIRQRMTRGDHRCIRDDIPRWQTILHACGWGAPAWP
ncbi:MAG: hypothetical protein ABI227_11100, partial [Rhodanobacter sp.]